MKNKDRNTIVLSGGVIDLDKHINKLDATIKGNTVINAINLHNNLNLKLKVSKNCNLTINMFDYAVELDTFIDVELDDGAHFILNSSFISEVKYTLTVNTKIYGNDTYACVNIRGINEEESTVKVLMNGTVAGETHGNVIDEYAKIINKSTLSSVMIPNLIINTNEVEANHGVSIGSVNDEELFYLLSKGIDKSYAIKLIEEGFLLSIMNELVSETIKNILVGR